MKPRNSADWTGHVAMGRKSDQWKTDKSWLELFNV